MELTRFLEYIFVLYFASHIPITLFLDLQSILWTNLFPKVLVDLVDTYATDYKDALMLSPPRWFKSLLYCELLYQLPFFFVATYAFWKGSCHWIRIPAIMYSTHVVTTLVPVIDHFLFNDFHKENIVGPETLNERLMLIAIYLPYLLIPLVILFTMLFSEAYAGGKAQRKGKLH